MDITPNECSNRSASLCCRACLSTDRKLFNIHECKLTEAFSNISGTPVYKDYLPQFLCTFCRRLLLKCMSFRDMCIRAQQSFVPELFQEALNTDYIQRIPSNSIYNLAITPIEIQECIDILTAEEIKTEPNIDIIDIDSIIKQDLKVEVENKQQEVEIEVENKEEEVEINDKDKEIVFVKDVESIKKRKRKVRNKGKKKMKIEYDETSDEIDNRVYDSINSSLEDEEIVDNNDVVYNVSRKKDNCKVKKEKRRKEKTAIKEKRKQLKLGRKSKDGVAKKTGAKYPRDPTNDMPLFDFEKFEKSYAVQVVTLSKEEQLEEIASRKKSRNYLESRFRCEECGKGYDAEAAYNNHLLRHSPDMGHHPCEICSVRFKLKCRRQQHQDLHRLKFLCKECSFVSRTRSQAKRHHAMHAGKTYECQHCGKTFKMSSTYLTHVRRAHAALNVACDVCGETFVGEKGLKLHKKRTHSENMPLRLKCSTCSAKFTSVEALDRHTDTAGEHADLRPCEQCGENCASEDALHKHVAETHPSELRRCEECGMSFPSATSYDVHHRRKHVQRYKERHVVRKRHTPRPPPRGQFVCEQCGRILPNATLLRYHQRTHQEVKPYACSECPKTFALKSSLNFHMRSHTGEKPFQCPLCPLAFSVKANLNRHHRTAHLKLHPRIPCSICGRVFTTNSCVRVHINTVHHGQPGPKRERRKRKNGKMPESPKRALGDADGVFAAERAGRVELARDCSVRLERLPSDAAPVADQRETARQHTTTTRTDTDSYVEDKIYARVDYEKEPIFDLCGKGFELRSDLLKHIIINIHLPTSAEEGQGAPGVDHNASVSSASPCGPRGRACSVLLQHRARHI